jgi:23S rRNA (cytidine2498-2'-O)-methyltransferase
VGIGSLPVTAPDVTDATVAYLAPEGLVEPIVAALGGRVVSVRERLVLASEGCEEASWWAANTWHDLESRRIESIGDGAKWLRSMQRNWGLYTSGLYRRAALLEGKLPPLRSKPKPFPYEVPSSPMGSWTLWESDLMLASARCSSPFANGVIEFEEHKVGPPSRAYRKLWEALVLLQRHPVAGERCIDLGASPGGWTWVLQALGASVLAIDKAALDPSIAALPEVEVRKESAFGLDPKAVGPVDWLFSDVICYPQRLLDLVTRWREAGMAKHFVCTIKFQGADEHAIAREFAAIPGSRVVHLHHNKHELTWMNVAE